MGEEVEKPEPRPVVEYKWKARAQAAERQLAEAVKVLEPFVARVPAVMLNSGCTDGHLVARAGIELGRFRTAHAFLTTLKGAASDAAE